MIKLIVVTILTAGLPELIKLAQKYLGGVNLNSDFYSFADKINAESPCPNSVISKKDDTGIYYTCSLRNNIAKHRQFRSLYTMDELKFTKRCTLKQYRKCRLTDNYMGVFNGDLHSKII